MFARLQGGSGERQAQGGVNSSLASRLDSTVLAALASFVGGLVSLVLLNLAHAAALPRGGRQLGGLPRKWWQCTGGVLGSCIMMLVLLALPLTGYALSALMRAAGLAATGLLTDSRGCLGSPVRPLTWRRVQGVARTRR